MNSYIQYVHDINDVIPVSFFRIPFFQRYQETNNVTDSFHNWNQLQKAIHSESNTEVLDYISEHLDLKRNFRNIVFTTNSKSYVEGVNFSNVRSVVNFKKINKIQYINKHFRSVNSMLPDAGIYIGRAETYQERKSKVLSKFGKYLGGLIWFGDFIFNRVFPKLRFVGNIYWFLTNGRYHDVSKAEVLGRLVYCGFEIIDYKVIDGLMYYTVMKTREPNTHSYPSYHPLIKLRRVGKNGKMIWVYKFRTMHPYSEFLQDFVIKLNGYNEVGKPANDFRVTRWGRWMRKLWIDEFPQLINVLKGEMKLVGIRPLSKVRFNQFPKDLQIERVKHKPGCFPPYVALNMPDEIGNIKAERIYLRDIALHPSTTDIKYLGKSVMNILMNKIRSS